MTQGTEPSRQNGGTDDRHRLFFPLFTRHQRRIFAYIYTLVPNRADAEDLLQETSITLWEKFHEFEQGSDFPAWACQIAYWKICNAWRKKTNSPVKFDDDLLQSLSSKAIAMGDELDHRHELLGDCLDKLRDRDRNLILARYEPGGSVQDLARRTGRTVQAVYKALTRIRKMLIDCVSLQTARGGQP